MRLGDTSSKHQDTEIRLKSRMYLTDRRDGKPRQAVEVSGGIVHAHTVYRDPKLAALSLEELQSLDSIKKKLALPAPDVPQEQEPIDIAKAGSDEAIDTRDASCGGTVFRSA